MAARRSVSVYENRLAILPDCTHYDLFTSPRLAATVLPFLNGTSEAKSWAEQIAPRSERRGARCDRRQRLSDGAHRWVL